MKLNLEMLKEMRREKTDDEVQILASIRLVKLGAEKLGGFLAAHDGYTKPMARQAAADVVYRERAYLLDYFAKLLNVRFVNKPATAE